MIAAGPGREPRARVRAAVRLLLADRAADREHRASARSRRAIRPRGVLKPGDRLVSVDGSARRRRAQLLRQVGRAPVRRAAADEGLQGRRAGHGRGRARRAAPHVRDHARLRPGGQAHAARLRATRPGRTTALPFGEARQTIRSTASGSSPRRRSSCRRGCSTPSSARRSRGVVGSYEVTRQTILTDFAQVVGILAIISLSLAIVNLFPFLPLDGGHIFWAIVEKVRGRPVPLQRHGARRAWSASCS